METEPRAPVKGLIVTNRGGKCRCLRKNGDGQPDLGGFGGACASVVISPGIVSISNPPINPNGAMK